MVKIVRVDGTEQKNASALIYLQLEILPTDAPMNPLEGYWWLAYDGDTPVGFACLTRSVKWSDCGYLARAGVLPSHRSRGLQKRLIRVRERQARAQGWTWMITDTFNNPPSANALIGCGYRTFTPSDPWGFKNGVYWRKALKKGAR